MVYYEIIIKEKVHLLYIKQKKVNRGKTIDYDTGT